MEGKVLCDRLCNLSMLILICICDIFTFYDKYLNLLS